MYTKLEQKSAIVGAGSGALIAYALGGIDKAILCMLVLVVVDYATGLAVGYKLGELSSQRGFRGIIKKISVFIIVSLAVTIDTAASLGNTLRTMTLCAFALIEAISILENIDKLGYGEYIPIFLRAKLLELKEQKIKY